MNMNLNKMTIEDIQVSGKKVLVRCDFNVPLDADRQHHRRNPHQRRAAHHPVSAGATTPRSSSARIWAVPRASST